jgi:hypothetical protein
VSLIVTCHGRIITVGAGADKDKSNRTLVHFALFFPHACTAQEEGQLDSCVRASVPIEKNPKKLMGCAARELLEAHPTTFGAAMSSTSSIQRQHAVTTSPVTKSTSTQSTKVTKGREPQAKANRAVDTFEPAPGSKRPAAAHGAKAKRPAKAAPDLSITPATGANRILNDLQTTGASAKTAKQDKTTAGVMGSRQMAENDRQRLEPHKQLLQQVANQYQVPPAVLAAIASRESRGGAALNKNGSARFDPNGYGLMQIDKKKNPTLIRGGPYSHEHIEAAAQVLTRNVASMKKLHPDWSETETLRGAISAYNRGPAEGNSKVIPSSADEMDRGSRAPKHRVHASTGGDYSADVWARAQFLASRGF